MAEKKYLEGATPYADEIIEEYTSKGWWLGLTFGDILDRSVASYPDKIAVIDEKSAITYRQLADKVDRFAIALVEKGIRKYDRILLQLPNRYEFVVAFYAAHRIGAVPVLTVIRSEYQEISYFFEPRQARGVGRPGPGRKPRFFAAHREDPV